MGCWPFRLGVSQWRLVAGGRGSLEDLELVAAPEAAAPLGVGEVRVGVRAAGLNFRDVLLALGMRPGEVVIGGEGAGMVLEVGPGVEELCVGDRVMGVLPGAARAGGGDRSTLGCADPGGLVVRARRRRCRLCS